MRRKAVLMAVLASAALCVPAAAQEYEDPARDERDRRVATVRVIDSGIGVAAADPCAVVVDIPWGKVADRSLWQ